VGGKPVNPSIAQGREIILTQISTDAQGVLRHLSLFDSIPSTNDFLLQLPAAERHAHAVLADQQSGGRGRRGRLWQSPPGSNIYCSLGWNFHAVPQDFSCLPLAVGVAVAQALENLGVSKVGLKWPNDILLGGKKLGGILVESKPLAPAGFSVVMGVGLNVFMPRGSVEAEAISQPWTSVDQLPGFTDSATRPAHVREILAGKLLDSLIRLVQNYAAQGFEPLRAKWAQRDVLRGKEVTATPSGHGAQRVIHGEACGIDAAGNLLVRVGKTGRSQQMNSVNAGEVSVRLATKEGGTITFPGV
jgi:BirA family biotin operon repressor/biotin-[acetyl-CoA-carboxylase] ligase